MAVLSRAALWLLPCCGLWCSAWAGHEQRRLAGQQTRPANIHCHHSADASNLAAIRRAAEHWRQNGEGATVPADYDSKLSLMTDYLRDAQYSRKYSEVPDRECRGMRLGRSGLVGCAGWLPLWNACHPATQPCPCSPHSPRPMRCIPATAPHCLPLPPPPLVSLLWRRQRV